VPGSSGRWPQQQAHVGQPALCQGPIQPAGMQQLQRWHNGPVGR
jgi:hypothetical protein